MSSAAAAVTEPRPIPRSSLGHALRWVTGFQNHALALTRETHERYGTAVRTDFGILTSIGLFRPAAARFFHWLTAPGVTPSAAAIRAWLQPSCFSSQARRRRAARQSCGSAMGRSSSPDRPHATDHR